MSRPLHLGFDRYQRFAAAARLIDQLAQEAGGARLQVLDVGAFDEALADFLPTHDYRPCREVISRAGGGLSLPAASQDVVVALDVLEHVPPEDRRFFLAELARVSRLAVVLGFPIKAAQEAEAFVLELTGSTWLAEHRQHGLPDPLEVEAMLDELGLGFTRHANASLPSWTAMMLLMHGVQDVSLRGRISANFNENFAPLEDREPAYRYIYLCRRG